MNDYNKMPLGLLDAVVIPPATRWERISDWLYINGPLIRFAIFAAATYGILRWFL